MRRESEPWELAPARCPICDAALSGERVQRVIPVGGRWMDQGAEHWNVRCVNGHHGNGDTLAAAIDATVREHRI